MQQPRANTQVPRLTDHQLPLQMFLQKKNKKSEGAVFEGFDADVEIATAAFARGFYSVSASVWLISVFRFTSRTTK